MPEDKGKAGPKKNDKKKKKSDSGSSDSDRMPSSSSELSGPEEVVMPHPSDRRVSIPKENMPYQPLHYALRPDVDSRIDSSKIIVYRPTTPNNIGLIILPGGNYDSCYVNGREGQPVAMWFKKLGFTCIVLKYRLRAMGHFWPQQYEDYKTCVDLFNKNAHSWNCTPKRFGVIGFSAGAHLASYGVGAASKDEKPLFQALVYPSMDTKSPHPPTRCRFDPWDESLGYPPPSASTFRFVDAHISPTFIASSNTDEICPPKENGNPYAELLQKHGVAHAHVFTSDYGHGCGMRTWWTEPLKEWLREREWARGSRGVRKSIIAPLPSIK